MQVRCTNADGIDKDFLVTIKYAAVVDLSRLHQFVK